MLRFILNDKLIETDLSTGSTVLDFIRYHKTLAGTKIGCREGDCGACTILVGGFDTNSGREDELVYRSMTSCLMPLGNAAGKHIVTVEGINLSAGKQGMNELTPVQQALIETNGTQCGFCTIGFVMSLTGFTVDVNSKQLKEAIAAIDGNICRCTGYKSIERAAAIIAGEMKEKPVDGLLPWLVQNGFIPAYFSNIKQRLQQININSQNAHELITDNLIVGGGTDLIVQKHLLVKRSAISHFFDRSDLNYIRLENGDFQIGASVTISAFASSTLIKGFFPDIGKHMKLVSSTPIRNMATLAGNLANASPIGDITVFLLALDATIVLNNSHSKREIKLKDFYKSYKTTDKTADEFIEKIIFTPPGNSASFSFEKVSKRTHLDIASVNTACLLQLDDEEYIAHIHISAGGVAPYPKYLAETVTYLTGKKISAQVLNKAIAIINTEIAPISDVRGTAAYKQLLLRQLFLSHFSNREDVIKEVLAI